MIQHRVRRLVSQDFILKLIAFGVFANGFLIIYGSLLSHLIIRRNVNAETTRLSISLVIGLSLIYLSTLINRRKEVAWLITVAIYSFILAINSFAAIEQLSLSGPDYDKWLRTIAVPLIVVCGLIYYRKQFNVRSDIQNFALSLRFIATIIAVAFLYGIVGLQLLDKHDFHQQLSILQSSHYTIDQFGLTTPHVLHAYTNRARVFLFTLSLVSYTSLIYAAISLFQPLRARFTDQTHQRQHLADLLRKYGGSSEDYFKIWPHDKAYIFAPGVECGLAYRVERGVALAVGDPVGNNRDFDNLMKRFHDMCYTNDWLPAFIHTEPAFNDFYTRHNYNLQKIGEEAVVDLGTFNTATAKNKYFRNITSKFKNQRYSTELLQPPHQTAIIDRLQKISDEWLALPGRDERGLMMGYFTAEYMQHCKIVVAKDEAGTIQGFINQIESYDQEEANFDLLRHSPEALGNINDYILMEFAKILHHQGYSRLNLGLSPLAGLKNSDQDSTIVDNALGLVYSRGDRLYSFSGLRRFKQKYEPVWQNRYIAHKGGLRGFIKTVNALNRAMTKSVKRWSA